MSRYTPRHPIFPYTTLFRSHDGYRCRNSRVEQELRERSGSLTRGSCWFLVLSSKLKRETGANRLFNLELKTKNRSEEHTSELQSQSNLVCRLLLEKKKKHQK